MRFSSAIRIAVELLILVVFLAILWWTGVLRLESDNLLQSLNSDVDFRIVSEPTFLLPPPLRVELPINDSSELTVEGVIQWTNSYRGQHGLVELKENELLSQAARTKLADMFDREYFAHVSPLRVTPSEVIAEAGYEGFLVAENLALGGFKDDQHLVKAWLKSPGHRKNLLNPNFREIGVAVGQGSFEGKKTWISVQAFGTPASICPKVDEDLKEEVEAGNQDIAVLSAQLAEVEEDLESLPWHYVEERGVLSEQARLLGQHRNEILAETKKLVEEYNLQVSKYDRCLSQVLKVN